MLRTSLRSASGPIRSHACASCLKASRRHVRGRRYYSTPANEDEQSSRTNTSYSADNVKLTSSTEETAKSTSTSTSDNTSTADADASKNNHKDEPPTSDKISFSGVLTRDLFKVTNPARPDEQRDQPETAKRIKPKKKGKPEKPEGGEQGGGAAGENKSSSKKKKSRKMRKTAVGHRMKKVSVAPRAKPPTLTARQAGKKPSRGKPARKPPGPPKPLDIKVLDTYRNTLQKEDIDFKALDYDTPPVPTLSFGLDRVLFNPGVYHLRDPRSRVYNFDPDLGTIMPVTEFDFNTLKDYITSSKDQTLIELARKTEKKYVGSSSSMTSVLSHFHYLLSNWRPLKQDIISRGFEDSDRQFTRLLRGPSAMFLHYKDGVYAIDADKEFDSANILMNLGKSMEKQLTLPKEQFERYRRSAPNKITQEEENAVPESYHYSTLGDFVMRSQLDAYDPRLPGSGMFDLKTRAVVSIRMSVTDYEQGLGYEIRNRFGSFESFEREYYDMIRAAFLKYSLQVRIGRMDGIFVAFHNIERIFGFQYVPLSEMDYALHGQSDTELGDREFQYSIKLWNEVLDRATAKYPKQSLRLHFETTESRPARMMVFVQPVTDDDIRAIQEKNKTKIEKAQQQMLYPDTVTQEEDLDLEDDVVDSESAEATTEPDNEVVADPTTIRKSESQPKLETETGSSPDPTIAIPTPEVPSPSAPPQQGLRGLITALSEYIHRTRNIVQNITEILTTTEEKVLPPPDPTIALSEKIETSRKVVQSLTHKVEGIRHARETAYIRPKLFGMEINIENMVNGRPVERPNNLKPQSNWKVLYTINEFKIGDGMLWSHFVGMKARREKALSFEKKQRGGADDHYILNLRRLAMQGKKFREEQDRIDKEQGIVVYEELKGDSAGSGRGSSGKA